MGHGDSANRHLTMFTTEQNFVIVISFVRHGESAILTRRDYPRVYHEMPSWQTVPANGLEYREQIPTTCVHDFDLDALAYIQRPFADVLERRCLRWDPRWPRLFEQTDSSITSFSILLNYNATSTSVVDRWRVDVFEPPRRIGKWNWSFWRRQLSSVLSQGRKTLQKEEILLVTQDVMRVGRQPHFTKQNYFVLGIW
jgi:hypothetical protein